MHKNTGYLMPEQSEMNSVKSTAQQTHDGCTYVLAKQITTRWKVLWESTNPRKSVFVANTCQLLFCSLLVLNFPTELFCKQSLVYRVIWPLLPHPLPIIMKHELGLPFPPRNLRIKFRANPSTIFLVIVVTYRHTHKPTPVKTYSLAFAGIINLRSI